ncbi:MAG: hypothetical protein ACHQXL_07275, partial [Candidatus Limnocylindrales bacterium]
MPDRVEDAVIATAVRAQGLVGTGVVVAMLVSWLVPVLVALLVAWSGLPQRDHRTGPAVVDPPASEPPASDPPAMA